MRTTKFIISALAALMTLASCQNEVEELKFPKLTIGTEEMTFDIEGGSLPLTVTSTRDWTVDCDVDWVAVTPESGAYSDESQDITVTVLENKGMDREVKVKFTINMTSKYLTIRQAGPEGSADQLILYYNDFDKEEATKTYGSGESWPYLDQFEGWKNQTGSGSENVTYAFSGMSARANSTSNSSYADYEGSGSNNLFFGSNAYFATKNIALNGRTDLKLSFGSEKYSQSLGSVFTPSEYHIYLSQDGSEWVEFTDYTFAGGQTEGRWNVATALFSVPAGTENLSICMKADAASAYRLDDMKLEVSMDKGTAVDFTDAEEMDFSANASGGNQSGGNEGGGNEGGGIGTTPPADGYIYFNNYDKQEATKTYGSGGSWPYLDQFEGWKNETGSGAANVSYTFSGTSARNNSNSNGEYSDYAGSGKNNIFFGNNAYIATRNIALGGNTNLVLTFGTEKYSQTLGSVFTPSEYHIYLSKDGSKWVELTGYTFAGGSTEGRWNVATAVFTVPAGTENLSICMKADAASSYRLDDFGLAVSSTAGTAVDFTQAVDMDFGSGSTGGGNTGGDTGGNTGGDTGGNTGGDNSGNTGGDNNGNAGGDNSGNTGGDNNGNAGGDNSGNTGGDNSGNTGTAGEYDPQGITWTLGTNAFDNTSEPAYNVQTATVNGVKVNNLLKLGTGDKVGDATLHIPAGTKKVGAYIVSWRGKQATLKFSIGGAEVTTLNPAANEGATGSPEYTLTVSSTDYYEIEVNATEATDMKVETTVAAKGRVLFIGLKAIQ